MNKIAFDGSLDQKISLEPEFVNYLRNNSDLELFWIHKGESYDNESDLHAIKVDRLYDDKYLIDFSGSGIENISQFELKLDRNPIWSFYYKVDDIYKKAFQLNMDNLGLNFTRNLILLDLSNISNIKFNFKSAYNYSSEVSTPLYQHYHKTNLTEINDSNVLDGTIISRKINDYKLSHSSYINYGDKSGSYLENNKVNIPSEGVNKIIIKLTSDENLSYNTDHGKFTPNSNSFNAFDNTELDESESDRYPLITIYGVDSLISKSELSDSMYLLIYDLDESN